jgi:uncharacterized YigZ family protein
MNIEQIKTIETFNKIKYKEKGSVFISQAYSISNQEEANKILNDIRKKFFDATHHCYAYKIFENKIKHSDEGEPSGSAGIRILNAIEHYGLTNILIVVIRYFGGIKLGIGPLGKAYYNSADLVLKDSKIVIKKAFKRIKIKSGFEHLNSIHRIFSEYKVVIKNSSYSDRAEFDCLIPNKIMEEFIFELNEKSKGEAEIKVEDEIEFI